MCATSPLRRLPGVSHWVQQEAPEAVNAIVAEWLAARVPEGALVARPRFLVRPGLLHGVEPILYPQHRMWGRIDDAADTGVRGGVINVLAISRQKSVKTPTFAGGCFREG